MIIASRKSIKKKKTQRSKQQLLDINGAGQEDYPTQHNDVQEEYIST
jgi:hypothetical protein